LKRKIGKKHGWPLCSLPKFIVIGEIQMSDNKLVLFNPQGLSNLPFGNLPLTTRLSARYKGGEIMKEALLSNLKLQGQAQLANAALTNLGSLTALESQLSSLNPESAHRFKAITDAFVACAIEEIIK
jgi:hypothetical protein